MKVHPLLPHSWAIEKWPEHVFPHTTDRGRYLVRMNRRELEAAGVLTRVGRQLVVLGAEYSRWLQSRKVKVADYPEIAANRLQQPAAARAAEPVEAV